MIGYLIMHLCKTGIFGEVQHPVIQKKGDSAMTIKTLCEIPIDFNYPLLTAL